MSASLLLLLLVGASVAQDPIPIEQSTYRLYDLEMPASGAAETIELFTSVEDCKDRGNVAEAELESCRPAVDRARGQVRLAFRVLDSQGDPIPSAIEKDDISVSHDGKEPPGGFQLVGYEPVVGGQLYILIIDTSGSMYANGGERINQVYKALISQRVKSRFLPKGGDSGVVLLRFNGTGDPRPIDMGREIRIIERQSEYVSLLNQSLAIQTSGYTPLYRAVRYAVGPLMEERAVREFVNVNNVRSPVIVVLTDGFNNEQGRDLCSTNVPRLQQTLDAIDAARTNFKPVIFTVGLGNGYFEDPPILQQQFSAAVNADGLCGVNQNRRIDGDLENEGIDNVSLGLLAQQGGGQAFVRNDRVGLVEGFEKAGVLKYRWYQITYEVHPYRHRKTFEVRIQRKAPIQSEVTVKIQPSPWIDLPTGVYGHMGSPSPIRSALAVLMPALGLLMLLGFLGPAIFNARRAIFRRSRRR